MTDKDHPRRGGLGRGLAALIPTAAEARPHLSDSAADAILGPGSKAPGRSGKAALADAAETSAGAAASGRPAVGRNAGKTGANGESGKAGANGAKTEAGAKAGAAAGRNAGADAEGAATAGVNGANAKSGTNGKAGKAGKAGASAESGKAGAAAGETAGKNGAKTAGPRAGAPAPGGTKGAEGGRRGVGKRGKAPDVASLSGARATPGLDKLIAGAGRRDPEPAREPAAGAAPGTEMGATYQEIPVGRIQPNERQPRQVFDPDELGELVHSIREFGLLQPIVVRPVGEEFEIIMGERRWRAAAKAGMDRIPAIVRESDDATMLRDALLENIHRVQLNPLEEGAAYQQLLEEFDVTQEELARRLGRSRPTITNTIRLLSLPVDVQTKVAAGVLSAGHARALMGLKTGAAAQTALAERVIAEGLSVRATEEAVTLANRGEEPKKRAKRTAVEQPEVMTNAAERLADAFDTRVTVTMGKRKGKMVIEFGDEDDFRRIMALIEKH